MQGRLSEEPRTWQEPSRRAAAAHPNAFVAAQVAVRRAGDPGVGSTNDRGSDTGRCRPAGRVSPPSLPAAATGR